MSRGLGAANAAQQSIWTISFHPHLWIISYTTRRCHVEIFKSRGLSGRRSRWSSTTWVRLNQRSQDQYFDPIGWYLQGVRRYHDRNVQQRSFNIGDLVLRRIQDETGLHKLNSRWEGPFIVSKVTRPGSYRITDADSNKVPNSWNIEHLRRFYPWSKLHGDVSWSL